MTLVISAILCIGSLYFYFKTSPDQRVDANKRGVLVDTPTPN